MGNNALVLTGGGARGAFQAGVLRGIFEITTSAGIKHPFSAIVGSSAGAINSAYLAARLDQADCLQILYDFWRNIDSTQVFRSDLISLSRIGLRWSRDLLLGGLTHSVSIKALLDTSPLRRLLLKHIPFDKIAHNINNGLLSALAIHTTAYSNAMNVAFVEADNNFQPWQRIMRQAVSARITIDHVMASCAIPLFFPPVKIDDHYYGDGSLRNTTPISPAIRLGADRVLVIGVRMNRQDVNQTLPLNPTVARVLSVILNSILVDAIEMDLERLSRINETLSLIPEKNRNDSILRPVSYLYLRPTIDIGKTAAAFFSKLPKSIQYLIRGLGSEDEASELVSYLIFEAEYCSYLAEQGYQTAMAHSQEVLAFLTSDQ